MAISNTRKLLLLPGDGIGPEVVKEVNDFYISNISPLMELEKSLQTKQEAH